MIPFIVSIHPMIWILLCVILGAFSIVALFSRAYLLSLAVAIVTLILGLACITSLTGFFIEPNTQAIIIDRTDGTIVGGQTFRSGIAFRPLITGDSHVYPASTNTEWCGEYMPSVNGGYELIITLCVYYDASNTDWIGEFQATGGKNATQIYTIWQNQLRPIVASATITKTVLDFNQNRVGVEQTIEDAIRPWFTQRGIPFLNLSMSTWNFANPEVAAAFDDTAVAQALTQRADQERIAAESERVLQLYRAETQNQVLGSLVSGQSAALTTLGIEEASARSWYSIQLQILQWLNENPDATVVVSVGDQPISIAPGAFPTPVTPVVPAQ